MKSLNYFVFLLATALLPFPQFILRPVVVAWLVTWLMEGRFLHRPQWQKTQLPFILFAAWFLLNALSALWASDIHLVGRQLERYLAFLLLLPVGIWGVNEHYDWKKIYRVLVISSLLSVGVFLLAAYWCRNANDFLANNGRFCATVPDLNYICNIMCLFKHRLYYGTILLLAMFASICLHTDRVQRYGAVIAWIQTIAICAIFIGALLLSGSRANLFAGVILAVVAIIMTLRNRHRKIITISVIALGLFAIIAAAFLHPRMQNIEQEPRLRIWQFALETPADYSLHGLGAGQSVPYLVERYEQTQLTHFINHRYNVHNQFLNEWMELGIGGLLLFLAAWGSILFCCEKAKRKSATLMVVLFGMNMLTECVFGRFDGIAIWAVSMIVILLVPATPTSSRADSVNGDLPPR